MRIRDLARAKINLTLRVLGRRADGYHELDSLVAFADVGDFVVLNLDRPAGLSVSGRFAGDLTGENLALTALRRCQEAVPALRVGHLHIDKLLPVAAGLGGGSADAAAVLRLLASVNPDHSERVPWEQIAASLGADVPVCWAQCPARIMGTGEIVAHMQDGPSLSAVLANALGPVPPDKTATVFRALAAPALAPKRPSRHEPEAPPPALDARRCIKQLARSGNDLEAAAQSLMPEIAVVKAALAACPGVGLVRLTGAGPTCVALFAEASDAEAAARTLAAAHPGWWIVPATIG